jgi:hypothetical protein
MRLIPRYAVIPSNGRECLTDCIEAIRKQVDKVIVIATARQMRGMTSWFDEIIVMNDEGEPNISRWWNRGLDYVDATAHQNGPVGVTQKHDVAVLNDDAIVPEGWFDAVSGTMRQMGCAAACSGGYGMPVLHTQNEAPPLNTRMQGFAFILAGELGLRADEQFVWYCGDDDLGRRAAVAGGMVMVPGFHVNHLYPNGQVSEALMSAIPGDMQRYVDKHGGRPW